MISLSGEETQMMHPEYKAALEAVCAAGAKFQPVRRAYHARQIGDAEFLAAQAEYKAAEAAFDVAYDKFNVNGANS
jgi:hypothetical protein